MLGHSEGSDIYEISYQRYYQGLMIMMIVMMIMKMIIMTMKMMTPIKRPQEFH